MGEVDFLSTPFVAFIRLQKAIILGDITEVAVPTRSVWGLRFPWVLLRSCRVLCKVAGGFQSDNQFDRRSYMAFGTIWSQKCDDVFNMIFK